MLEAYGPCISTASWVEWPRHRKILATPFNENLMRFVWNESLNQTREATPFITEVMGTHRQGRSRLQATYDTYAG